jgi:hypothetical protein
VKSFFRPEAYKSGNVSKDFRNKNQQIRDIDENFRRFLPKIATSAKCGIGAKTLFYRIKVLFIRAFFSIRIDFL